MCPVPTESLISRTQARRAPMKTRKLPRQVYAAASSSGFTLWMTPKPQLFCISSNALTTITVPGTEMAGSTWYGDPMVPIRSSIGNTNTDSNSTESNQSNHLAVGSTNLNQRLEFVRDPFPARFVCRPYICQAVRKSVRTVNTFSGPAIRHQSRLKPIKQFRGVGQK